MKINKRHYVTIDRWNSCDLCTLSEAEHIHPDGFPITAYIEAYSHAWWVAEAEEVVLCYGDSEDEERDLAFISAWERSER